MWYMNGAITLDSAYQLTPSQRKSITELMEYQIEQKKKANK